MMEVNRSGAIRPHGVGARTAMPIKEPVNSSFAASPHVQIVLDDGPVPSELEAAIRRIGATASFRRMSEAIRNGLTPTADALVIIESGPARLRREQRVALLGQVARQPRATLVLTDDPSSDTGAPANSALPVTIGRGLTADELAGRLTAMVSMRKPLEALWHDSAEARRAAHHTQERYQEQMRIAGQLQRDLMATCPPSLGPVRCSTVFRTCNPVSGDFYDIRRLDENHVGIGIADAAGYGVSAALLTVFLRRGMSTWQREGGGRGIRRPHELLTDLNRDLLAAQLTESPYVAACYAVLNIQTLTIDISRAGAPMPVVRRADGTCTMIDGGGMVLGVSDAAGLETQRVQLHPGDAILIHTDGLECAAGFGLTSSDGDDDGFVDPEADPRDLPAGASWLGRIEHDGVSAVLEQAGQRYDLLRRLGHEMDDMTLVALTVDGGPQ